MAANLLPYYTYAARTLKLAHIPTVGGPSFPILSYIGAVRYLLHAPEILEEGYAKVSK